MLPILLDLKVIKIYTFGVFLILAFFWGMFWLWRNIKLTSYKEEDVFDGLFISLFGSVFFARLLYVLLNFQDFGFSPLKFILINGYPGLSLYGGLSGGFLIFFLFTRYKKIQLLNIADYMVAPLFLALTIGSLGAFFSGNEPGTQTDFILRIQYVGYEGFRHLVGLYEAILLSVCAFIAHRLMFKVRREKIHTGGVLYFFLIAFPVSQLLLDFMKQNHLYLAELSFNVVASAVVLTATTVYLLVKYRRSILGTTKNLLKKKSTYGTKTNEGSA